MIDLLLILGLVITVLLSIVVYSIDRLINKKEPDRKKYSFIRRYPIILLILLIIFGLIYGYLRNQFARIVILVLLIALPLAFMLYYIRSLDEKGQKKLSIFIMTYVGMILILLSAVIFLMIFHYEKDLEIIKNNGTPMYARENSFFTIDKNTCGTTFYEEMGYRVEYCSKYVNANSYRIKFWFSNEWTYQLDEGIEDSKWCNCEDKKDTKAKKETKEEQKEEPKAIVPNMSKDIDRALEMVEENKFID